MYTRLFGLHKTVLCLGGETLVLLPRPMVSEWMPVTFIRFSPVSDRKLYATSYNLVAYDKSFLSLPPLLFRVSNGTAAKRPFLSTIYHLLSLVK